MRLTVKEMADLTGVSVRTLHYYDEIGLLKPSEVKENGYRYYHEEAITLLQQIIFFRELDFSLKEIAEILKLPDYDRNFALVRQRTLLQRKKQHLEELIHLIDKTTGGIKMEEKMNIANSDEIKQQYAKEAKERWGDTAAYKESQKKHKSYGKEEEEKIAAEADEIFAGFAALRDHDPGEEEVQSLVARWQDHICKYYYQCSKEMLSCLGQMYVADQRFTENLDRFGQGNAAFMAEAIAVYCR